MTKDFKGVMTSTNNQHGVSWMLGGIAVGLLAGLAIFSLFSNQNSVAQATPTTTPEAPVATTATVSPNPTTTSATTQAEVVQQAQADIAEQSKQKPVFSYHAMLPQIDMESSYKAPNINRNPATKAELAEERRAAALEKKEAAKLAAAQKKAQEAQLQQVAAQQVQIIPEPVIQQAKGRGVALQLGAYSSVTQAKNLQKKMSQRGMNTRIEQGLSNGSTVYRVRIGPSVDMSVVNQWRRAAASMGIQPMNINM